MLPFAPVTDMAFAGDLKFLQLLYGIKTGNAKYECPWCWWCATGGDRDPVTTRDPCQERDVEAAVRDFV